jgi:predicted amidohydrolase YtcJ
MVEADFILREVEEVRLVVHQNANEKIALAGVQGYVSLGFTTAQGGRASSSVAETWRKLGDEGRLGIDVAVYPDLQSEADFMLKTGTSRTYTNHVCVAGVKLSLDGSPQGKTAWLTKPYLVPPAGQSKDYVGYPSIPNAADADALVDLAFKHNWQVLAHCNGVAAGDALTAGKLADLVILDQDPVKVDLAIRDIHVLETIKEGVTRYKAP